MTALYFAAQRNAVDVAERLLKAGAKPNATQSDAPNPVAAALSRGHVGMAKVLLAAEGRSPPVALLDQWIHEAVAVNATPVMAFLLGLGADPNSSFNNMMALSAGLTQRNPAFFELMIARATEVGRRTPTGITILMNAAIRCSPEGVDLLLKAGAKPLAVDGEGWTAAAHAAAWGPLKYRRSVTDRLLRAAPHTPAQLSTVLAAALAQGRDGELADWLVREHGAVFDPKDPSLGLLVRRALESGGEQACRQAVMQGVSPALKIQGEWNFAALAEYYNYRDLLAAMAAKQNGKVDTTMPSLLKDTVKPLRRQVLWWLEDLLPASGVLEIEVEVLIAPDGGAHFPRLPKDIPAALARFAAGKVMETRFNRTPDSTSWRRVTVPLICFRGNPDGTPKP